jgi:UDP-N-acetylglucosamine 2-epimerase (non-hydrolysing)
MFYRGFWAYKKKIHMKKIKILTVFGTRPEVIKLAPFIKEVESDLGCISITCATTQHRELQNDVLTVFNMIPTYNLGIMRENQELAYVTRKVLEGVTRIITQENPDFIVVQGDTTTAFSASLAAFYQKVSVVHIEAGLRTGNMLSPFPEEANRKLIAQIATLHMAPTKRAAQNLIQEGAQGHIFMMGNTIVDSVH